MLSDRQRICRLAQKINKYDWGQGRNGGQGMKEAVRNERKELGNEEEATGCVWKDFLEPFPSL